jgi:signal transduction histidine kinase
MNGAAWWKSLQARLALGGLVWVCLGVTLSGAAMSSLIDRHVTQQFEHEINDHLGELQSLYAASGSPGALLRPVSDPRFEAPGSGFYWEIWRAGAPVLRSPSLEGKDMVLPAVQTSDSRAGVRGAARRLIYARDTRTGGDAPVLFAVGVDESQLRSILADFQTPLFTSLVAVALGLCLAATAQVAFGLRPLRKMRAALAQVRAGKAETLPEDFPSEVLPLVRDLNDVIRINREMIQRARAQAGNLAHGLRTPLSILTSEAERLAREGKTEAAEAILQECRAMRRQIDHQIARARAAANRTIAGPQVKAAPLVGEVVSALGRYYADRHVVFVNDVPSDVDVACDPDDLMEILANILDNAGKWAKGRVTITAALLDGRAEFVIEDDGPGIPQGKRATVFNLGERLDERPAGSGLGLTIVRDLVALYDGSIRLDSSPLGGLRVTVRMPRPRKAVDE